MKFVFTDKMLLEDVERNDSIVILKFRSFLKEDFIEKALTIYLENNLILKMFFSSNRYGIAGWANGKGIFDAHCWEDEDDLIKISALAKHYPVLFENGAVSQEYARKKIISDVLDGLLDQELASKINYIVKEESSKKEYNWGKILEFNKELSDNFIKDLIKAKKFVSEHTNDKSKPDDNIAKILRETGTPGKK